MTMKNTFFWDVTPSGSCKNRRFGGKYRLYHQGDKNRRASNKVRSNFLPSVLRLLVTPNVVPSSLILWVPLLFTPIVVSSSLILWVLLLVTPNVVPIALILCASLVSYS
jgi:hypothetical protein